MRNPTVSFALWCLLLALLYPPTAYGLNETSHEIVNQQAAKGSVVDQALKQQLGVGSGLDALLQSGGERNSVLRWIMRGGFREDDGSNWDFVIGRYRPFRHFHDPLKPWDRAGFSSPPWLRPFESSLRWAQRPNQTLEAVGGSFSLLNARNSFGSSGNRVENLQAWHRLLRRRRK